MFFKFCPKCKGNLKEENKSLLICKKCGFHFYLNPKPTTALILENDKREILLTNRKINPQKGWWDLPGGFVEKGEDIENCARREAKEELGVDIYDLKYLRSFPSKYLYQGKNNDVLGFAFTGKVKSFDKMKAGDDVAGFKFFLKDKIPFEKIALDDVKKALKYYIKKENEK